MVLWVSWLITSDVYTGYLTVYRLNRFMCTLALSCGTSAVVVSDSTSSLVSPQVEWIGNSWVVAYVSVPYLSSKGSLYVKTSTDGTTWSNAIKISGETNEVDGSSTFRFIASGSNAIFAYPVDYQMITKSAPVSSLTSLTTSNLNQLGLECSRPKLSPNGNDAFLLVMVCGPDTQSRYYFAEGSPQTGWSTPTEFGVTLTVPRDGSFYPYPFASIEGDGLGTWIVTYNGPRNRPQPRTSLFAQGTHNLSCLFN